MTQIKIAYSTVPLNYLASCYSIPPVWFPQWPIPSHLFNHRELEIWMEWQVGQSSINQFLFVYSSITSIREKFSRMNRTLWPRGAARKKRATRRRGRWDAIPPSSDEESADEETACDVGEIPSLERETNFLLRRVSRLVRSIRDFKIQDATASRTRWLIKDWD